MATPQHERWVKESECWRIIFLNKSDLRKACYLKAIPVSNLYSKPADPKKLHSLYGPIRRGGTCVNYTDMKNTQNARIPEWVSIGSSLARGNHNVALCSGVHRILISTDIVSCIVYAQYLCWVDVVIYYAHSVSITIGKGFFVAVVITIE